MTKIFTICLAVLVAAVSFAQAPNKMSYQAVVRNSSNSLVVNQAVGMRISLLQGSASGASVYTETQSPTTNANGLVSIEIGGGTVVSGNFANINWANGPYFIKTETDPNGGTNYSITGTSQLLSVPYALCAKKVEEKQTLSISGNVLNISEGNSVTLPSPSTNFNIYYPDNISAFEPVNLSGASYTVPFNKNLYTTRATSINGVPIVYGIQSSQPKIISSGQIVTGAYNGFLVDKTIDALAVNLALGSYTVPTGKKLVVLHSEAGNNFGGGEILVDNISNSINPMFLISGQVLSINTASWTNGMFYGYLLDQ